MVPNPLLLTSEKEKSSALKRKNHPLFHLSLDSLLLLQK
jgi:hypothetical protein